MMVELRAQMFVKQQGEEYEKESFYDRHKEYIKFNKCSCLFVRIVGLYTRPKLL